jgi:hypothetical protein
MESTLMHLHPRPGAKSASGHIGAIGLPPVYCTACWRPLNRQLISRVASAVAQGKMDQSTVRCLRPDCRGQGEVDLELLLLIAEIAALRPTGDGLGRGRPVRWKRCPRCGQRGNSRWYWLHSAGGRKCETTGAVILPG